MPIAERLKHIAERINVKNDGRAHFALHLREVKAEDHGGVLGMEGVQNVLLLQGADRARERYLIGDLTVPLCGCAQPDANSDHRKTTVKHPIESYLPMM